MNEKQAKEKEYHFHGAYSHYKEEMKQKAAELRAQGNKAIVVDTPPSKYSRGYSGMGYSVYWIESEENKQGGEQARLKQEKLNLMAEREKLVIRLSEIDLLLSPICEEGKKEVISNQ